MSRRAIIGLGLLALLPGCAEMRAPPATPLPAELAGEGPDPYPRLVEAVAAAFAEAGRGLAGNPAAMARAAGQLELLAAGLPQDARWPRLSPQTASELRLARTELRGALGIRAGAAPTAVADALAATHRALRRGDTRAAQAALDPALFEPGGAVNLARLASPGLFPQARIATGLAREEVTRVARARQGGTLGLLGAEAGVLDPMPGPARTLPGR